MCNSAIWNKYHLFSNSCAIACTHYDFYYVFIRNFVQKKIFISNEFTISCKPVSYWFENNAKFRAKKSFCAKTRNCCARESSSSLKPNHKCITLYKRQTGTAHQMNQKWISSPGLGRIKWYKFLKNVKIRSLKVKM